MFALRSLLVFPLAVLLPCDPAPAQPMLIPWMPATGPKGCAERDHLSPAIVGIDLGERQFAMTATLARRVAASAVLVVSHQAAPMPEVGGLDPTALELRELGEPIVALPADAGAAELRWSLRIPFRPGVLGRLTARALLAGQRPGGPDWSNQATAAVYARSVALPIADPPLEYCLGVYDDCTKTFDFDGVSRPDATIVVTLLKADGSPSEEIEATVTRGGAAQQPTLRHFRAQGFASANPGDLLMLSVGGTVCLFVSC
ncbi:MAG: hypothetical protein AAF628_20520 [Planctomycetota bacterium]